MFGFRSLSGSVLSICNAMNLSFKGLKFDFAASFLGKG